jgi:outer membrane lipoprotein-sorting protein
LVGVGIFIANTPGIVEIMSKQPERQAMRFVTVLLLMAASQAAAPGPVLGCCAAGGPAAGSKIDKAIEELDRKVRSIETLRCGVLYRFSQPLFESQSVRTGEFLYCKTPQRVRVNFETLQQDDEEARPYREQYILDGGQLVHVNYAIRQVKRYARSEPNEPVDASGLGAGGLGLLGLTGLDRLRRQFEIALADDDGDRPEDTVCLRLRPRGDSIYREDFTRVEILANTKSGLPEKVTAVSTQDDVYEIRLLDARVNRKLDDGAFEPAVPGDFSVMEAETGQGR